MASAGVLFEPAFRLPDRPEAFPAAVLAPALRPARIAGWRIRA